VYNKQHGDDKMDFRIYKVKQVALCDTTHKKLKTYSVRYGIDMVDIVDIAINEYLKRKQQEKKQ